MMGSEMPNLTAASHAAYRRGTVMAATPAQLVVLLYDGARRFMRQAVVAMGNGEIERTHTALRDAERIISHLDGTLDFEQGEVAHRLHAIYQFYLSHLRAARLSQDPAKVEEINELMGELRDAWNQVANEVDGAQMVAGGSQLERA
jgi:flagellar secretion chaperone FliS